MTITNDFSQWLTPDLGAASFQELAEPESQMSDQHKELRKKFEGDPEDGKNAAASLKGLYEWQLNRARHAETRAATVQGAVSIAASLIFAGASLALDRAKINESELRWVLAALAAAAILAFVCAALRAMQAHMVIQPWTHPDIYSIGGSGMSVLTPPQQAGEYWNAIMQNERIVNWKLDRLDQARWHFRNAVLMLGLLAVGVLFTVVMDSSPAKKPTQVEIVRKP
jgi:hypothetical protein